LFSNALCPQKYQERHSHVDTDKYEIPGSQKLRFGHHWKNRTEEWLGTSRSRLQSTIWLENNEDRRWPYVATYRQQMALGCTTNNTFSYT